MASNAHTIDGHGGHGEEHAHSEFHIHHPSASVYYKTFLVLMGLLVFTVILYYVDLSKYIAIHGINLIVAMVVAITKAAFVVMNFMNVKGSTKLTWLWAGLGFIWLLLMGGIFMDFATRVNPEGWQPTEFIQAADAAPAAGAVHK